MPPSAPGVDDPARVRGFTGGPSAGQALRSGGPTVVQAVTRMGGDRQDHHGDRVRPPPPRRVRHRLAGACRGPGSIRSGWPSWPWPTPPRPAGGGVARLRARWRGGIAGWCSTTPRPPAPVLGGCRGARPGADHLAPAWRGIAAWGCGSSPGPSRSRRRACWAPKSPRPRPIGWPTRWVICRGGRAAAARLLISGHHATCRRWPGRGRFTTTRRTTAVTAASGGGVDRLAADDPTALGRRTVVWRGPEPVPLTLLTDHHPATPRAVAADRDRPPGRRPAARHPAPMDGRRSRGRHPATPHPVPRCCAPGTRVARRRPGGRRPWSGSGRRTPAPECGSIRRVAAVETAAPACGWPSRARGRPGRGSGRGDATPRSRRDLPAHPRRARGRRGGATTGPTMSGATSLVDDHPTPRAAM